MALYKCCTIILRNCVQNLIAFCNQPEAASDVIYSVVVDYVDTDLQKVTVDATFIFGYNLDGFTGHDVIMLSM